MKGRKKSGRFLIARVVCGKTMVGNTCTWHEDKRAIGVSHNAIGSRQGEEAAQICDRVNAHAVILRSISHSECSMQMVAAANLLSTSVGLRSQSREELCLRA
jgi:hypothetical protein